MALDFFAGCLGGCAGVAVGHPFDTVKVRIQTQDFNNPRYRGTWHCITDTIKKESVRGLYKGMSSPMAGVAFVNAIVFGVHGNMSKHIKDPESLRSQVLCGATAGLFQSFVSSPMELVKTRVQLQTEASAASVKCLSTAASSSTTVSNCTSYSSPLDCLRKIYTMDGWRGLFRGQLITIYRDVPGFASYFLTYEYLTRALASKDGSVSPAAVLFAGGSAGAASWVFTYPIDVIKSRLQADGIRGASKYKGIIHCAKASIAAEGMGVMFRGLNSSLIRAFPTNAATFAVVTWTLKLCQAKEEKDEMHQSWRDVLARGEVLVKAAGIPAALQLRLDHHSKWKGAALSLLPHVHAVSGMNSCSEEEEESDEEIHENRCKCNEKRNAYCGIGRIPDFLSSVSVRQDGSETQSHSGVWARGCGFLSCRRRSLWALTQHQHNLSIVL